ncbi:MAG: hypothetical protein ACM34K_02205 [Bacillota bacterium]
MGFAVIIDLLGSIIIGGMLMVTLMNLNGNATENTYAYTGELVVQEYMVGTIEALEYDLKKIGYCEDPSKLPNPAKTILFADTSEIKFLTDTEFDGDVDTVRVYLGSTSELNMTPNPNDRMLYRSVNSVSKSVNLGVTQFKIKYFDAIGYELTTPLYVPTGIASMQIDIRVENTAAYNEDYKNAYWRQIRLASRNLNNR